MLKLFWGVFLWTVLIFIFVLYMLLGSEAFYSKIELSPNAIVLCIAALCFAIASLYVRRFMFSEERLRVLCSRQFNPEQIAINPRTGKIDPEELSKLKSLTPREQKIMLLISSLLLPTLIPLVLGEVVGLLGVVLALLEHQGALALTLIIIALIIQAAQFPQLEKILAEAEQKGLFL